MLREIHTINGNSRLGYLWVLIQSIFGIAVFWGVRYFSGAGSAPHGLNTAVFLATGFCLWNIFSSGITRCMSAVDGNRALLTFPQVTEFDVMVARIIVISATQIVTAAFIIFCSLFAMGDSIIIGSIPLLLFLLICVPILSLGCGMIFAALAVFAPALNQIIPMILRIMFFVSGVFFSASIFSQSVADVLFLNPILHAIELIRMSLHEPYVVPGVSWTYVLASSVVTCAIGGYLERYVRSRRRDE